jgi:hypothetical protein
MKSSSFYHAGTIHGARNRRAMDLTAPETGDSTTKSALRAPAPFGFDSKHSPFKNTLFA